MIKFKKANNKMSSSLKKLQKFKGKAIIFDIENFYNLIIRDYKVCDGIVIPKDNPYKKNFWKNENSRTAYEAFDSHQHMSDFIEKERGIVLLKFGLIYAFFLSLKLKKQFPRFRFRIIVSYNIKNEFGYNDCVVRFHKIRKNEERLIGNLNDYKDDAVGYFDV